MGVEAPQGAVQLDPFEVDCQGRSLTEACSLPESPLLKTYPPSGPRTWGQNDKRPRHAAQAGNVVYCFAQTSGCELY